MFLGQIKNNFLQSVDVLVFFWERAFGLGLWCTHYFFHTFHCGV